VLEKEENTPKALKESYKNLKSNRKTAHRKAAIFRLAAKAGDVAADQTEFQAAKARTHPNAEVQRPRQVEAHRGALEEGAEVRQLLDFPKAVSHFVT